MPQGTNVYAATLPALATDGTTIKQATTGFGDLRTVQLSDNHTALADAGCYYRFGTDPALAAASNPSFTTLTTGGPASGVSVVSMWNRSLAPGRRIFMDYLKLIVTTVASPAINVGGLQYAITTYPIDRSQVTVQTFGAPVNANSDYASQSVARPILGAATLNAPTGISAPQIARGSFKRNTAFPLVVGDIYEIDFGEHAAYSANLGYVTGTAPAATGAGMYPSSSGPLVIGPNQFWALHVWSSLASTVMTVAVEMGWWER